MTKADLINQISEKAGITRVKAETVVNTIFDSMIEALMRDDRIEIRGFGSFVNRQYGAYQGRNPRTGEIINVGEKKLPFFKVGKDSPITATISEGVAYLTKEGISERKKRKSRVAYFYAKRSTLTHAGDGEVTAEELTELTLIARDLTLLMIQHREKFATVQAFRQWLEDQKLSGLVQWPD